MSAIPAIRRQTVDASSITVTSRPTSINSGVLFARIVAFVAIAAGVYLASTMVGSVLLEVGRQKSIDSREDVRALKSRQAYLRGEVYSLHRVITESGRKSILAETTP